MVNFCTDAMTAQEGVDREGEVQCRTVLRHGLYFSLRGKDKYFGCKEVQFNGIEEVHGIGLWVVQDFLDGAKPFFQFAFVFVSRPVLVFPMCGKSLFSDIVHAFASDLYFNPLSFVTHQCYMKGLITIGFRMIYPITQSVGVWLVYLGNSYIDAETFVGFHFKVGWVEDDTYGQDVVYFFERNMFGLHLVPNGIRRLDTSQDAVFDTHLVQFLTDRSCKLTEEFFAFVFSVLQ